MNLTEEIKKPTHNSDPNFETGTLDSKKSYEFKCTECGSKVLVNYNRQTTFSWTGHSDLITQTEYSDLKNHYGIGISQKSHDGGFPVFDKVRCKNCGQQYVTYAGVREFANSAFKIHIQGIGKIK